MAFKIAPEADPLIATIFNLLSPIVGIEARLRATSAVVGQITVNAVQTASLQTQQDFNALSSLITAQATDRFGFVQDLIDAAALQQRREIESIGLALDGAVTTFRLSNQAQLDATLEALGLAAGTTQTAIRQAAENSQGVLSRLGENIKDNILSIPGDFASIIKDPLGAIQAEVQGLDSLLGTGFGSLGVILSLGFPLLADTMANIFNINPEDFQAGIERVLPAIVDMSRVAGNTILEE